MLTLFIPILASLTSALAQDYRDADLVNGLSVERIMSGTNISFDFPPQMPSKEFVEVLSDPKKRQVMLELELHKIKNVDSNSMCCENKDCFNPIMQKREWLGVIEDSLKEFGDTFSESISMQPLLTKSFFDEIEVLKHDPSCTGDKNDCRGKLKILFNFYTSMFTPNFPDVPRPKKYVEDSIVGIMSDYAIASSHKEKFETYKVMAKLVATDSDVSASKDPWYAAFRKIMIERSSGHDERSLGLFYGSLRKSLGVYQAILSHKASRFDLRISKIINPREGYVDPSHRVCNTLDFLKDPRSFRVSLAAALPVLMPEKNLPKPPCLEQINYTWERNVEVMFSTGSELLDEENEQKLRASAVEFFEEKKREGFTVTGYKILASASQPWGSLPLESARQKNEYLARKRAESSQKIIDSIPGFSDLDHISHTKLEMKNSLAKLEEKPVTSIKITGPGSIAAGVKAKTSLTDEKISLIYESIKDELLNVKGIKSLEEYTAYLTSSKITNTSDATFKPFQFFKIIVEGRKKEDKPCSAEIVGPKESSAKSNFSSKQ